MTTAWNDLYDPDVTRLPVTDLYVRFLPADEQELYDLQALNMILYDWPLEYEVIQEGVFYHDPAIPSDEITWQYAVVKPDFVFPAIQYEILSELVLAPYYSDLTMRAFAISGNGWRDPKTGVVRTPCTPDCENWPDCLEAGGTVPCNDPDPPGGGDPPPDPNPPCVPFLSDGSPNDLWPDCLMVEVEIGISNPSGQPTIITNDCGCEIFSANAKPGGCVRVEDTELGLLGVQNVQIIVKDGWFGQETVFTDENGCWRIDEYYFGDLRMWVKFKSDRVRIRGFFDNNLFSYSSAVKDNRGEVPGQNYNDIQVEYLPENDDDDPDKMYWYACHYNNALYEFDDYAAQDGVQGPPNDLVVLLTNIDTDGAAAPMFDKLSESGDPFTQLVLFGTETAVRTILYSFTPVGGLPLALGFDAIWAYLVIFAPDVVDGYGGEINRESDRIKNTAYHEYAHAAHYNGLNNEAYWTNNVLHIAANLGYGDGDDPGSHRCALIESWGEFIGDVYTDREYGIFHSRSEEDDTPEEIESRRWIYEAEETPIDPAGDDDGWIPWGLNYDLVDDDDLNPGAPEPVDDPALDFVTGYSIFEIFTALSLGLDEYNLYRDEMLQILPANQTVNDVTILFQDYEWIGF